MNSFLLLLLLLQDSIYLNCVPHERYICIFIHGGGTNFFFLVWIELKEWWGMVKRREKKKNKSGVGNKKGTKG